MQYHSKLYKMESLLIQEEPQMVNCALNLLEWVLIPYKTRLSKRTLFLTNELRVLEFKQFITVFTMLI